MFSSVSAASGSGWGVADPTSISQIICYGVGISGPEPSLQSRECHDSNGATVFRPGILIGTFGTGAIVSLDVPPGPSRTIYIIGFAAASLTACKQFNDSTGPNRSELSAPQIIGATTLNLAPGPVDVSITVGLAGARKFDDCSGISTIPGTSPTPFPSPTPIPSPTPAVYKTFVFATNSTDNTISTYIENPISGALTVSGSAAASGVTGVNSIATHPTGKFLYAAGGASQVQAFSINGATGALTAIGAPVTTGAGCCGYNQVVVDPSGKFAYVAIYGNPGSGVYSYTINQTTGTLSPTSPGFVSIPATGGYGITSMTINPASTFVYVANNHDNQIYVYAINPTSGVLTVTGGSPFVGTAVYVSGVAMDPAGKFLFGVDNQGSSAVASFLINLTNGNLGSAVSTGATTQASGVPAIDPSGKCLFVTNGSSNFLSAFSINTTTGVLTESSGSPYTGPNGGGGGALTGVVIDPNGQFVFSAGPSNTIYSYYLSVSTCQLIATSPASITSSGNGPQALATVKVQQ